MNLNPHQSINTIVLYREGTQVDEKTIRGYQNAASILREIALFAGRPVNQAQIIARNKVRFNDRSHTVAILL